MSTGQAAPDPWKSFRGVMAGTLILEAIVVLLALPVVAAADHGLTALRAGYLIGFAIVLVLLAGLQGRPWAIWVNLAIQAVLIAGWLVNGAVGFIGLIFAAVWAFIAYLRAEVAASAEARTPAGAAAAAGVNGRTAPLSGWAGAQNSLQVRLHRLQLSAPVGPIVGSAVREVECSVGPAGGLIGVLEVGIALVQHVLEELRRHVGTAQV